MYWEGTTGNTVGKEEMIQMGLCGHGFIFKEKYSTCMLQRVFTIVGQILTFYKKSRHQILPFTCACTFCIFYFYEHCK